MSDPPPSNSLAVVAYIPPKVELPLPSPINYIFRPHQTTPIRLEHASRQATTDLQIRQTANIIQTRDDREELTKIQAAMIRHLREELWELKKTVSELKQPVHKTQPSERLEVKRLEWPEEQTKTSKPAKPTKSTKLPALKQPRVKRAKIKTNANDIGSEPVARRTRGSAKEAKARKDEK